MGSTRWIQLGSDIDGESLSDYSGSSVSLSNDGSIVAIGAPNNDGNGSNSGQTRVYQWDSTSSSWNQLGSDIDGEDANDYSGFSISLSNDGSIVAIGAPNNDGNGSNSGQTRVYQWDSTSSSWNQLGNDIDGEAAGDYSGASVSLSADGSILAIGAYQNANGGHTRIYQWDSTSSSWNQLGSDIDGEAADDYSGYSVSLSNDGSIVAIGAFLNDGNGTSSGHTRIYQWNSQSSSWNQLGDDIDGETLQDRSGGSVSLSADGSIVAIGAANNDGNGSNSGQTRVYQWDSTSSSWNQLGSDIDGEAANDYSGASVSLSADGSSVAVGARFNDGNGFSSGHTRIYQWDSTSSSWNKLGSDIDGEAAGDRSGYSVSLSNDGSIVAIGAYANDNSNSNSGHVRVLNYDTNPPVIAITEDDFDNSLVVGELPTITFTLSEASTDFVESDVNVSGGSLSHWTAVSSTVYTATFTPAANSIADGVISVASSKFSDSAGNTNNDGSDANNSISFKVNTNTSSTGSYSIVLAEGQVEGSVIGTPLTRFYNSRDDHHFLTSSAEEIDLLTGLSHWNKEGIVGMYPAGDSEVVHRFFNQKSGAHFYTIWEEEKESIINDSSSNYAYEGIAFNAYSPIHGAIDSRIPIARYYNSISGSHIFSSSENEQEILDKSTYFSYEGIGWYADIV